MTSEYEFTRADELELLVEAARSLDEIEALRAELARLGPVVPGSQGQPVANPALSALDRSRGRLVQLLRGLGLDVADAEESAGSRSGRRAADARWGHAAAVERRRKEAGDA